MSKTAVCDEFKGFFSTSETAAWKKEFSVQGPLVLSFSLWSQQTGGPCVEDSFINSVCVCVCTKILYKYIIPLNCMERFLFILWSGLASIPLSLLMHLMNIFLINQSFGLWTLKNNGDTNINRKLISYRFDNWLIVCIQWSENGTFFDFIF